LSVKSGWSTRELENQIKRGVFERTMMADQKLSSVVSILYVLRGKRELKSFILSAIKTFKRKARLLSSLEDDKIKGFFADVAEEEIYAKAICVFYLTGSGDGSKGKVNDLIGVGVNQARNEVSELHQFLSLPHQVRIPDSSPTGSCQLLWSD